MNRRGLEVEHGRPAHPFRRDGRREFFHGNRQAARLADAVVARGRRRWAAMKRRKNFRCMSALRNGTRRVWIRYNNMLRATVEALAGVLGGCDSMQVGAFDEVVRPPDDFSRRIARNTQLILQKECESDPGDRSGGRLVVSSKC